MHAYPVALTQMYIRKDCIHLYHQLSIKDISKKILIYSCLYKYWVSVFRMSLEEKVLAQRTLSIELQSLFCSIIWAYKEESLGKVSLQ